MYIFLFLWICWQHCFYILCDQTQQQMHISMSKLEFPVSFDMFPEKSSTCQETFNRFVSQTTSILKNLHGNFLFLNLGTFQWMCIFTYTYYFSFVMNENDVRKTHMIDSSIQKQSHEQKKYCKFQCHKQQCVCVIKNMLQMQAKYKGHNWIT